MRGYDREFKRGVVAVTAGAALPAIEPALYVVATPIGNLRDLSARAIDVLSAVDVVAAEDTRVTGVLLAHHSISTRMLSLHAHNEKARTERILGLLDSGKSVALVTDAGTPAVSDPGATLVSAVAAAGHRVIPVPGASAVITALSASGVAASEWLFCGFLPAKAGLRQRALARLASHSCALVFYEAPHRVVATVASMASELGANRRMVIARELTKRFESIHRCRLGEAAAWLEGDPDRVRGEFVLIVDAPPAAKGGIDTPATDHDATLAPLLAELPLAQAVRLAVAITGAPRNALYRRALALKRRS
jgi:16S rRNA (cytidine1402-2'-O)-methyltransferase